MATVYIEHKYRMTFRAKAGIWLFIKSLLKSQGLFFQCCENNVMRPIGKVRVDQCIFGNTLGMLGIWASFSSLTRTN